MKRILVNMSRKQVLYLLACCTICSTYADVAQLQSWIGQKASLNTQRATTTTDIKNSAPQSAPATAQVIGFYQQQNQQITTDHTLNATRPSTISNDKLWDSLVNYYKGRVAADPQLSQMIASGQVILDGAFGTGQMTFATSKPEQIMQLAAAYAMPYYLSMAQKEMVDGQLQITS